MLIMYTYLYGKVKIIFGYWWHMISSWMCIELKEMNKVEKNEYLVIINKDNNRGNGNKSELIHIHF